MGPDEDLPSFAVCFLKLLGDKLRGAIPQKTARLGGTASTTLSANSRMDLEPALLEVFQRVWDPEAPSRCRSCYKAMPCRTLIRAKC